MVKYLSQKVLNVGQELFDIDNFTNMSGSRRFENNSDTREKSPAPLDYCFKHEFVLDYGLAHTDAICNMEIDINDQY